MWGATLGLGLALKYLLISIHAPMWGATPVNCLQVPGNNYFNPRSHVGSDGKCDAATVSKLISIHAPMWGATIRRDRREFDE